MTCINSPIPECNTSLWDLYRYVINWHGVVYITFKGKLHMWCVDMRQIMNAHMHVTYTMHNYGVHTLLHKKNSMAHS